VSRNALGAWLLALSLALAAPCGASPPTEILFQAFPWDAEVNGQKYVWYRHLEEKAPQLAAAGVTQVWFPPVSRSVAPQGYMPGDYYDLGSGEELGDNRTLYGNAAELKSAVARNRRGIGYGGGRGFGEPPATIPARHTCNCRGFRGRRRLRDDAHHTTRRRQPAPL